MCPHQARTYSTMTRNPVISSCQYVFVYNNYRLVAMLQQNSAFFLASYYAFSDVLPLITNNLTLCNATSRFKDLSTQPPLF